MPLTVSCFLSLVREIADTWSVFSHSGTITRIQILVTIKTDTVRCFRSSSEMTIAIETVLSLRRGLHRPGSETVIRLNRILKMAITSIYLPDLSVIENSPGFRIEV